MNGVMSLQEVAIRMVSLMVDDGRQLMIVDWTYRLAKDIWQVKHLKGLTLVSVRFSQPSRSISIQSHRHRELTG